MNKKTVRGSQRKAKVFPKGYTTRTNLKRTLLPVYKR